MQNRLLTVIEQVCKYFEGEGITSVGAIGALNAMSRHWKDHVAEGHSSRIISEDIEELINLLEAMRDEILCRISDENLEAESPVRRFKIAITTLTTEVGEEIVEARSVEEAKALAMREALEGIDGFGKPEITDIDVSIKHVEEVD